MKNKIMIIISVILIILLIRFVFWGIKIGDFQICSVSETKDNNNKLNEKIETASKLTSIDYFGAVDKLEETYDEYNIQQQKYEELSGFVNDKDKKTYEMKQYDISYLWKTIGNYATKYNIGISVDVKNSSTPELYDLHFSVSGTYVNILTFIYNIENDSNFYFRIYNFNMSGSSETVNASFVVKDINIDPSTLATGQMTNIENTQELE